MKMSTAIVALLLSFICLAGASAGNHNLSVEATQIVEWLTIAAMVASFILLLILGDQMVALTVKKRKQARKPEDTTPDVELVTVPVKYCERDVCRRLMYNGCKFLPYVAHDDSRACKMICPDGTRVHMLEPEALVLVVTGMENDLVKITHTGHVSIH